MKGIIYGLLALIGGAASFGIGASLASRGIPTQAPIVAASPIASEVSKVVTLPSVAIAPTPALVPAVNFDQLSPCEQLESVARSGKSVSEFLVAANRVNDLVKYRNAISSTCHWNSEQLAVADRIISPPVVVLPSTVIQETVDQDSLPNITTVPFRHPLPLPPVRWNNCDGTIDPGESYSQTCANAQRRNDHIRSNGQYIPENPIDNRPEVARPNFGDVVNDRNPGYPRGWSSH